MGSSLNPICQFLNLALKVSVEKQIVVLNSLLINTTCSEMSYAISFLHSLPIDFGYKQYQADVVFINVFCMVHSFAAPMTFGFH